MLGETVTVYQRHKKGTDKMGEPVYEWTSEQVENVLVRPLSASDVATGVRPDGIQVKYSLAFPKTYTKGLRHARVSLTGRGMDDDPESALHVIGDPAHVSPCPTKWNRLADVGRRDG